jgi:hypothetical protein
MALPAHLLFIASVALGSSASMAASNSGRELSQADLRNAEAVVHQLKSGVDDDRKRSARTFFTLGDRYRQRALKDGNWSPVAKAYGESAVLYPRTTVLIQYAESSLKAQARSAAARVTEGQLELLKQTVDIYDSALASEKYAPQLTPSQQKQLEQHHNCSRQYLTDRKVAETCPPLLLLGVAR